MQVGSATLLVVFSFLNNPIFVIVSSFIFEDGLIPRCGANKNSRWCGEAQARPPCSLKKEGPPNIIANYISPFIKLRCKASDLHPHPVRHTAPALTFL